tara:strand:- start:986 stop:1285 length:300 start_codon:yes stop_codon:yes gene_type:complete
MMQIAQQQLETQLMQQNNLLAQLKQFQNALIKQQVSAGSLIFSNHEVIYLSIGLGKINSPMGDYLVISTGSPLGRLFLDKTVGDQINFNKRIYTIESIC